MVQQVAPTVAVQTFDAIITARVCTPGTGCVLSQVRSHLRVFDDGSWFVSYWDPEDESRSATAMGTEPCESCAASRMLAAIASLAPEHP